MSAAESPPKAFHPGLELLAQHAERWREVHFWFDSPPPLKFLSRAKGNLPLLECLHIIGNWTEECDIFEIAPRLEAVRIQASQATIAGPLKLPWNQLHTLELDVRANGLVDALSLMGQCSSATKFTLRDLSIPSGYDITHIDPPSLAADIHTFTICVDTQRVPHIYSQLLAKIFSKLTFRRASTLHFESNGAWPLPWSQQEFIPFALRSSCLESVTSLTVLHILISEAELLQCLSELPLLKVLSISDPGSWDFVHDDNRTVTNNLLRRLTWSSDSHCLIPRLHEFHCRNNQGPFHTSLTFYAEDWRPALGKKLTAFAKEKKLEFQSTVLEPPFWR
ncbi:hypothetical protein C8R44DRAFT_887554 [Mycena epipterygia]|nr:hypothetical protein C8R44DRAFT_887554 [Mycena epipterygia]